MMDKQKDINYCMNLIYKAEMMDEAYQSLIEVKRAWFEIALERAAGKSLCQRRPLIPSFDQNSLRPFLPYGVLL